MECNHIKLFVEDHSTEIIAGHAYTNTFQVFLYDGAPVDLMLPFTRIEWTLSPYGYPEINLLQKVNNTPQLIVNKWKTNEFTVYLNEDDTKDLDANIYLAQVVLSDIMNNVARPYEGKIVVQARNLVY